MARRKKNSNEKARQVLLNKTSKLQVTTLISLKLATEGLNKEITRLLNKIESEGTNGYYSGSSDVLRWAQTIWKHSWRLGEMKRFEDEIKSESFFSNLDQ